MQFEKRKEGDILIVKVLNNRLDAQATDDFKKKMAGYISDGNFRIVLNMSAVDFVDSSGLGAMVSVIKSIGENGQLSICSAKDPVMRMFKLTRMNKVFAMFEEENKAVAEMSK